MPGEKLRSQCQKCSLEASLLQDLYVSICHTKHNTQLHIVMRKGPQADQWTNTSLVGLSTRQFRLLFYKLIAGMKIYETLFSCVYISSEILSVSSTKSRRRLGSGKCFTSSSRFSDCKCRRTASRPSRSNDKGSEQHSKTTARSDKLFHKTQV